MIKRGSQAAPLNLGVLKSLTNEYVAVGFLKIGGREKRDWKWKAFWLVWCLFSWSEFTKKFDSYQNEKNKESKT